MVPSNLSKFDYNALRYLGEVRTESHSYVGLQNGQLESFRSGDRHILSTNYPYLAQFNVCLVVNSPL